MGFNRRTFLGGALAFSSALALTNPVAAIAKNLITSQQEQIRYDSELCSLDDLIKAVNNADITFIGDQHTNDQDKVTLANVLDNYDGENLIVETGMFGNINEKTRFLENFHRSIKENSYRVNNLEGVMNKINNGNINLISFGGGGTGDNYAEILASRDKVMANQINQQFKQKGKTIIYCGNDHLLDYSLPNMIDEKANVVRIFQAVSPIENEAYAINASFDKMLDALGKEEMIFKIGENDYFVINHSPEERRNYDASFFEERVNRRLELNNAFQPVDNSYPLVPPVKRLNGLNMNGEENVFEKVQNILESEGNPYMKNIEAAKINVLKHMGSIANPKYFTIPIKGVFEEYDRLNVLLKERRLYVNNLVKKFLKA